MAMTTRKSTIQSFTPSWPEHASLSSEQVRFTYDRPTDTLFVDFHGEACPAASVPLDRGDRDYLYLRVAPETNAVVGLQIEHFLSYAVVQHPELVSALDVATLVGIDRNALERIIPSRSLPQPAGSAAALIASIRRLSA